MQCACVDLEELQDTFSCLTLPFPLSQALSNGYVEDVDWSESSEEGNQALSPTSAPIYNSSVPRFQSTAKADGYIESPITQSISPIPKSVAANSSLALTPQGKLMLLL